MDERTDTELVIAARQGDKDVFGLLVERYQSIARRFAMRLVANGDLAQELSQEALLQAYLSLDRLRDPERFKGWLLGIVLNVCRNHLRGQKIAFFSLEAMAGGLPLEATPLTGTAIAPEKLAEERELHQTVLKAINELAPPDRDVTLLFYYDQLSLQEIAELRGVSIGAIKVRLHRARQRLKLKLISRYPEIIPGEKRRKKMIQVTIADVVKKEHTDDRGNSHELYVILLWDEAGRRALPVWVGTFEGQSIAMGLKEFPTPRPLTYNFFASLLQTIKAEIEQVRIEMLKGNTFYAVVKIRCGQTVKEVDARPSDAMALATLTGSPILVAEDVFKAAGIDMPPSAVAPKTLKGVESILKEIPSMQSQTQQSRVPSPEEIARAREELIASVFGG